MEKNYSSEIKNSFIGMVSNINSKIKSYYKIKLNLKLNYNPSNWMLYIFIYFYTIVSCGFSNKISKIEGKCHRLVKRIGHFKVKNKNTLR